MVRTMKDEEYWKLFNEFTDTVRDHYPTNKEMCEFFYNKGLEHAIEQQESDYTGQMNYF